TIPGSPYHMADLAFGCTAWRASTVKQDRSISAEAVVFPGKITVVKNVVPDDPKDFGFSSTGGLDPAAFFLDDDPVSPLSNTREFSGLTSFAQYSVTETDPAPFSLTALECTDDMSGDPVGSTDTGTRTATFTLAEGQAVTCTFTNSVPPDCTTDADCSSGVCDETSGKCVACLLNSDCSGSTPICDTSTNTCVPCTGDPQCGGGVCDEPNGTCVECVASSDCPGDTPVCQNHACEGCTDDTQCAPGVCDETSGKCVACLLNSDCSGRTPICDTSTNTCVPCTGDPQCAGFANTPACDELSGECVQCTFD